MLIKIHAHAYGDAIPGFDTPYDLSDNFGLAHQCHIYQRNLPWTSDLLSVLGDMNMTTRDFPHTDFVCHFLPFSPPLPEDFKKIPAAVQLLVTGYIENMKKEKGKWGWANPQAWLYYKDVCVAKVRSPDFISISMMDYIRHTGNPDFFGGGGKIWEELMVADDVGVRTPAWVADHPGVVYHHNVLLHECLTSFICTLEDEVSDEAYIDAALRTVFGRLQAHDV